MPNRAELEFKSTKTNRQKDMDKAAIILMYGFLLVIIVLAVLLMQWGLVPD